MLVKVVFGLSLAAFLPGIVLGIPLSRRGSESAMNKPTSQFHPRFNSRGQHQQIAGPPGKRAGPMSRVQPEPAPERNPYELIREARMGYHAAGNNFPPMRGADGSYSDFVNNPTEAPESESNDNFGMLAQPSGIANEAMMQKAFGSPNFSGRNFNQQFRSMASSQGLNRRTLSSPMTGDPEDY